MNARPTPYEISPQWREITHEQVAYLDRAPLMARVGISIAAATFTIPRFAAINERICKTRLLNTLPKFGRSKRFGCRLHCGERRGICKHAIALLTVGSMMVTVFERR
jgi:hypothetical protein